MKWFCILLLICSIGCNKCPTCYVDYPVKSETREFVLTETNTFIVFNEVANDYSYSISITDEWFELNYDYSCQLKDQYGNWWYVYGGESNWYTVRKGNFLYTFRSAMIFKIGSLIKFHKTG